MDTTTIEGVTLTLNDVKEVLAFWDAHCTGRVPERLAYCDEDDGLGWTFGYRRAGAPQLTPAVIDQLRDFAMPWTEVESVYALRRGDRIQARSYRDDNGTWSAEDEGMVTSGRDEDGDLICVSADGGVFYVGEPTTFRHFVRRPRVPTLRLRDVGPGQRFRFASVSGGVHIRTLTGWLPTGSWNHGTVEGTASVTWDTPVTLVDEAGS